MWCLQTPFDISCAGFLPSLIVFEMLCTYLYQIDEMACSIDSLIQQIVSIFFRKDNIPLECIEMGIENLLLYAANNL